MPRPIVLPMGALDLTTTHHDSHPTAAVHYTPFSNPGVGRLARFFASTVLLAESYFGIEGFSLHHRLSSYLMHRISRPSSVLGSTPLGRSGCTQPTHGYGTASSASSRAVKRWWADSSEPPIFHPILHILYTFTSPPTPSTSDSLSLRPTAPSPPNNRLPPLLIPSLSCSIVTRCAHTCFHPSFPPDRRPSTTSLRRILDRIGNHCCVHELSCLSTQEVYLW